MTKLAKSQRTRSLLHPFAAFDSTSKAKGTDCYYLSLGALERHVISTIRRSRHVSTKQIRQKAEPKGQARIFHGRGDHCKWNGSA